MRVPTKILTFLFFGFNFVVSAIYRTLVTFPCFFPFKKFTSYSLKLSSNPSYHTRLALLKNIKIVKISKAQYLDRILLHICMVHC